MIPPELPELIGGKYRPLGVIGEGAMGIVYSVEHTLTGEHLALKVMTAHHGATRDAIERFKREARAAAKIKSEHVVRVLDADVAPELDRAPYLVMDLLDGVDLEKASGDQPLPPTLVVEWLRQVARTLDKAHRIGITHRDLKPENLFLTNREDGSPLIKVLDFGIAKISAESTGTTQSGQILGTPLFMAPEQARGDPEHIGPPADLYALGLIAYKLLAGTPYWTATSVAGIIGQVLYEPMTPPSSRGCKLGPGFDQWFFRACNRDSASRFPNAVEQIEQLARALALPYDSHPELKVGPGDSGNSIGRSDSTARAPLTSYAAISTDRRQTATLAQSGGTLVSSSTEMPDIRVVTAKRRRGYYVAASIAVLVCILGAAFYNRHPAAPAMATMAKPVAAVEPVGAAGEEPSIERPAPAAAPTSSQVVVLEAAQAGKLAPSPIAVNVAKRREAPKPPPPSRAAGSAPPTRSDRAIMNDPLGDQK